MGTVFAAVDETLRRRVAVKVLKPELAEDDRFVERFRREARAAAALSHPNVATVFDFGEDSGTRYIVMELVEGRDLALLLREEGPLRPDRARRIAAQMASALAHAHSAGLVHRDVKPANVIVGEGDRAKVTDFGIARAAGESTLTVTGSVLGSAHYMAPEQASGAPVTAAADVYSAGIVLYEMLTNAVPFTGDSPVAVAMRHVSDDVPPPSNVNPQVPEELDRIVAKATARDPAERWGTAAGLAAALDEDAAGATAPLVTGATTETTVWPIPGATYDPRRLGQRVLVIAGVLALLSIGVWMWLFTRRGDEPARASGRRDARPAIATEATERASQTYELEDFTGWAFTDAESALKEHGVVVHHVEVPSEAPKDEVIGSDPAPGTAVTEGQTVTLSVSTGTPEEEEPEESGEEGPGNSEEAPGHSKAEKNKAKDKD
jgi:serine/threonine-protein kinase